MSSPTNGTLNLSPTATSQYSSNSSQIAPNSDFSNTSASSATNHENTSSSSTTDNNLIADPMVSDNLAIENNKLANSSETINSSAAANTTVTTEKSPANSVGSIYDDPLLKEYGIDINHLDAKSTLLLASIFHIFANSANLGADVNGNIAVGVLGGSIDFGTRGDSIHLCQGDIYYIQKLLDSLNSGSFRNEAFNHVIFGENVNVEIIDDQVYINGNHMPNLNANEVFKDTSGSNYIDFPRVFARLIEASNFYAAMPESDGIIKNFDDMNNRYIDVSNAIPTDNVMYMQIPADFLAASQPIKIYGLSSKADAPTIIITITGIGAGDINISTQTLLYYDDRKTPLENSESHEVPNHILWNFTEASNINITSGRFMGSILAPLATLTATVNVDGNIIANVVNITGGESHRWDLFPVIPTTPDNDDEEEDKPGNEEDDEEDDSIEEDKPEFTPGEDVDDEEMKDPESPDVEDENVEEEADTPTIGKPTTPEVESIKLQAVQAPTASFAPIKQAALQPTSSTMDTKKQAQKPTVLPQTGDSKTNSLTILGLCAVLLGLIILPKKKVR
ncbi:collagen-binding domain-containing protein [Lactobacillaceae bacterium 24-114]